MDKRNEKTHVGPGRPKLGRKRLSTTILEENLKKLRRLARKHAGHPGVTLDRMIEREKP